MRRQLFERVQLLLQQNRYALAQKELIQLLEDYPDDPLLHALYAHCLLEMRQATEALKHAEQAVAFAPNTAFCYYILSLVQQELGQLKLALEALRSALALDPLDPDYFAQMGLVYFQMSQWQASLNASESALRLDPEHVDALNLRGMALIRLGQKELALETVESALLSEPDNARVHANRGWMFLQTGRHTEALDAFQEALRLNPELAWAREGMLDALKARFWMYRQLQKYFFMMARHSRKYQFASLIVLIVVVQLLSSFAGAYSHVIALSVVGVYFAFAMLTWLADPLFNLLLRFHPQGRLVLNTRERQASSQFALVGGISLCALGAGLLFARPAALLAAGLGLSLLVPMAGSAHLEEPRKRAALERYTLALGAVLVLTLVSYLLGWRPLFQFLILLYALSWLGFSWFANWTILRTG